MINKGEKLMIKVREDLIGKVFGRLTVIEQAEDYIYPNGKRRSQWLCECSCEEHNRVVVEGTNLRSGNTTSGGCVNREKAVEYNKKYNQYDLSGEFGIGWTTNTGREFYFDLEDFDKIKEYCWGEVVVGRGNGFHVLCTNKQNENGIIRMHQMLGFSNYDHIDRNEFNNRKNNLRPCTRSQNKMNGNLRSDNTSGVIGVSQKRNGAWMAELTANKEVKLKKVFSNKDDAIRARLNAEVKYFGEFAPQRHLYEQYGIKEAKE